MSRIVDPRLFELVQIVSVSSTSDNDGSTKKSSGAGEDPSDQANTRAKTRQIVSFASSPCGRMVVFVASTSADVCESPVDPKDRAFLGAIAITVEDDLRRKLAVSDVDPYKFDVQWVPWFQDANFRPSCVTLSPECDHCLVGCENGSFFVIPTRVLCPKFELRTTKDPVFKDWPSRRVHKVFPVDSNPESKASALFRTTHPSSVVWWCPQDRHNYAIIGTKLGWIVLVDLIEGKEVGFSHFTNFPIIQMEPLSDSTLDSTYLFITNEKSKQWRLLLEKRTTGFVWCGRKNITNSTSSNEMANTKINSVNGSAESINRKAKCSGEEEMSTRSRLAGLKQMSVASLVNLRQRLSESRRMLDRTKGGGLWSSSQSSDCIAANDGSTSPNATSPESLASKVGDTLLSIQTYGPGNPKVIAGLFPDTSILTLHNFDLEVLSQSAFKLPRHTEKVLVLNRVMVVANKPDERTPESSHMTLQVLSSQHAEIHLDSQQREDPVLQNFILADHETILGFLRLFPLSAVELQSPEALEEEKSLELFLENQFKSEVEEGVVTNPNERFAVQVQTKVALSKSKGLLMFEPCLLVTSYGVFILKLARDPVSTFLESIMQGDVKKAEHTAETFQLDNKALIELAADIRLSKKDYSGAQSLYKLSGSKFIKVVLKFAFAGHVQALMNFLLAIFKATGLELSLADKVHMSNMMLMVFFQQALTKNSSVDGKAEFVSHVCSFMDTNHLFDLGLAVRLAADTREWSLLHHFCTTRGMYREMLATICAIFVDVLQQVKLGYGHNIVDLTSQVLMEYTQSERLNLWLCLSNTNNLTSCIGLPALGIETIKILNAVTPAFDLIELEKQSNMCTPSKQEFRPLFRDLVEKPAKREPSLLDDFSTKIIDYYISVQLAIIKRLTVSTQEAFDTGDIISISTFDPDLVKLVKPTKQNPLKKKITIPTRATCRLVSAGSGHVLLIRPKSGLVLSFGATHYGVLGHSVPVKALPGVGTVAQHSSPQPVDLFAKLNRTSDSCDTSDTFLNGLGGDNCDSPNGGSVPFAINVLSVSCGKLHSLALTDCGLYAWGSSHNGQLGLGKGQIMSNQPKMVTDLSNVVLVSISAGSYHSAAIDSQGKLWTWGWGVHGQLGLGKIEDEFRPQRVVHREMQKEKMIQVEAGYAHTIVLTAAGNVWAFGCGLFGQLGNGDNKKHSNPIRIDFRRTLRYEGIDDKIVQIATKFFHCLALSADGEKVYIWGCSPQTLRFEAQQKRRDRIQQSIRNDAKTENSPCEGPEDNVDGVKTKKDGDEDTPSGQGPPPANETNHLLPSRIDLSMLNAKIVSISCGGQHSVILTADGLMYTFGRNTDGQLGLNSRKEFKTPTLVFGLKEDKIFEVACGNDYTLALSETGSLFGWGNNQHGQLGKIPQESNQKESEKTLIVKGTKRVLKVPTNVMNSWDIPKPVIGVTSGVFSSEFNDVEDLRRRFVTGCERSGETIAIFERILTKEAEGPMSSTERRIQRHRYNLHVSLETFHSHLDLKSIVKKCMVSENFQAAAKAVLLKERSVLQAFELSLQACIKQRPTVCSSSLGDMIFDIFYFYMHYDTSERLEDDEKELSNGAEPNSEQIKQHLLERLIACWHDQKFSFVRLEQLLMRDASPTLLQTLVRTLFCPDGERDEEGDDGPMANIPGEPGPGPPLVDLFTPEFCLRIGDTFVNRWRDRRTSSSSDP